VDVRDFINGTAAEKDEWAALIAQAAFAFSAQMVMLIYSHSDSMPDEMREDVQTLLTSFYGYVSEFVDLDELEAAMTQQENDQGDEE
jgi:hypothetical protein